MNSIQKPTKQEFEIFGKLAEVILSSIHAKISIPRDPYQITEWAESRGQRSEFVSSIWTFQIESDLGSGTFELSDRSDPGLVKTVQEVAYRGYKAVAGDERTQEMMDHIFQREEVWLEEFKKLTI